MTEIIAAVLTGIISSLLTAFISIKQFKLKNKDIYAKNISQSRINWTNEFREDLANMLSSGTVLNEREFSEYLKPDEKEEINARMEQIKIYEFAKNRILSKLNFTEDEHILLYTLLTNLKYESAQYKYDANKIISLVRDMLKDEWERVKEEAGGMK